MQEFDPILEKNVGAFTSWDADRIHVWSLQKLGIQRIDTPNIYPIFDNRMKLISETGAAAGKLGIARTTKEKNHLLNA